MFGIGIEKIVVLVVVGLFVLGPERLPGAVRWIGQALHRVRSFTDDAHRKLDAELGPEIQQIRQTLADLPLPDLTTMRNPRRVATRWLLSEPDPPTPAPAPLEPNTPRLTLGERPPIDPEAT